VFHKETAEQFGRLFHLIFRDHDDKFRRHKAIAGALWVVLNMAVNHVPFKQRHGGRHGLLLAGYKDDDHRAGPDLKTRTA